jgi:predicted nucleic acid-binding protein
LPKIIADSSALISLAHGQLLESILKEFEIVISNWVLQELEQTARFDDPDGKAAQEVLTQRGSFKIVNVSEADFRNYLGRKVHAGEASCLPLARQQDAVAFVCDDFDALPYLDYHSQELGIEVGLCPVLIQALILRGKLTRDEGRAAFDRIAERWNWLGRPLYEYGKKLLEK